MYLLILFSFFFQIVQSQLCVLVGCGNPVVKVLTYWSEGCEVKSQLNQAVTAGPRHKGL